MSHFSHVKGGKSTPLTNMEKQEEFVPPESNYEIEVELDTNTELQAVKQEEAEAIERTIGLSGQNLSAEPDFREEEVTTTDDDVMEVTE